MNATVHMYEYLTGETTPNGSALAIWQVEQSSTQGESDEGDFILPAGYSVGEDSMGIKHIYSDMRAVDVVTKDNTPHILAENGTIALVRV